MLDGFWAAPPVARTLTALVLIESIAYYGGLLAGNRIIFAWSFITKFPPEPWRFITSFLLSGPQLAIIFDPFTIWQYASALETQCPRFTGPGDFLMYIIFVSTIILITAHQLLGSYIFTGALITAISYTYAQENRGKKINFVVIPIDVKYLPFANIFLCFIINGPEAAKVMLVGIPAAHLYEFLTKLWPNFGGGHSIMRTPTFVANFFGGQRRVVTAKHGTAIKPANQATTTTYSSGWGGRGQGQRLGGE